MIEKRNQRELLWFQTGGALNFITALRGILSEAKINKTK
jgi:hypothetical protein